MTCVSGYFWIEYDKRVQHDSSRSTTTTTTTTYLKAGNWKATSLFRWRGSVFRDIYIYVSLDEPHYVLLCAPWCRRFSSLHKSPYSCNSSRCFFFENSDGESLPHDIFSGLIYRLTVINWAIATSMHPEILTLSVTRDQRAKTQNNLRTKFWCIPIPRMFLGGFTAFQGYPAIC